MDLFVYALLAFLCGFDIWYKSKHAIRVEKRCVELEIRVRDQTEKYHTTLSEKNAMAKTLRNYEHSICTEEEKFIFKEIKSQRDILQGELSVLRLTHGFMKNKIESLTELSKKMEAWASEEVGNNTKLSKENHELRLKFYGDKQQQQPT